MSGGQYLIISIKQALYSGNHEKHENVYKVHLPWLLRFFDVSDECT